MEQKCSFDQVWLKSQHSTIRSRDEVNIKTKIHPDFPEIDVPLLSAGMTSVSGFNLVRALGEYGGLGIFHRYITKNELWNVLNLGLNCGLTIGLEPTELLEEVIREKPKNLLLVLDIAHADNSYVFERVKQLQQQTTLPLMVGNVSNPDSVGRLAELGIKSIKIGQSNGAGCSTKDATGIFYPQFSSIQDSKSSLNQLYINNIKVDYEKLIFDSKYDNIKLISDGAISKPADFCKAMAAGASACMLGKVFAQSAESEAEIISETYYNEYKLSNNNTEYQPCTKSWKKYYGMASKTAKEKHNYKTDYIEGKDVLLPYDLYNPITVKDIVKQYSDGLKSAMSYCNAKNIQEFQINAEFINFQER